MNKIILLNGTTKYKDSSSEKYLDIIYNNLDKEYLIEEIDVNKCFKKGIDSILASDIIVLAFPLFADSLPSSLLRFLLRLEEENITNKQVYTIVNCGYFEGEQASFALEIIENFCLKNNLKYMGGLGIGGGPVGHKKRWYNFKTKKALKKLALAINYQNYYQNNYTRPLFPRFIYILVANISWYYQIKTIKK